MIITVYPIFLLNSIIILIRPNDLILKNVKQILEEIFEKNNTITCSEIQASIERQLKRKKHEITQSQLNHVLFYLLYYQYLFFDYNTEFTVSSTFIWNNFGLTYKISPLFTIEPNALSHSAFNPKLIPADVEIEKIDDGMIKIAEERYKIISPLLTRKGKSQLTREVVKKVANDNETSTASIYRWIRAYNQSNEDWKSLIPRKNKRANRSSRIVQEVEELIQNHILYKCDCCRPIMSIRLVSENISNECQLNGYRTPNINTIKKRTTELKAIERKGTQGGVIKYEISQSIIGKLPRGEYPLHFVQVDSTILDIFVVDDFDKKIKRPFITIFIDIKTRIIFSNWMTLRDQLSVDIKRGLMRGFLPKDDWLKDYDILASYPIYGIPYRLQFDNAKIFDTDQVREFCFRYGIGDYQFRMVKRPDKGGFVEWMFKTINGSWLSAQEGYAPPLKLRPAEFRPEKKKKLFKYSNFKKWFLLQVLKYHNTNHSGLRDDTGRNISPMRLYEEEMSHRIPRLPENPELLRFEVLAYKESPLRPEGITFRYNRYNNDGNTGLLRKIRARNLGKKKRIGWRYDPEERVFIN